MKSILIVSFLLLVSLQVSSNASERIDLICVKSDGDEDHKWIELKVDANGNETVLNTNLIWAGQSHPWDEYHWKCEISDTKIKCEEVIKMMESVAMNTVSLSRLSGVLNRNSVAFNPNLGPKTKNSRARCKVHTELQKLF